MTRTSEGEWSSFSAVWICAAALRGPKAGSTIVEAVPCYAVGGGFALRVLSSGGSLFGVFERLLVANERGVVQGFPQDM
eukprot:3003132-Lingulodinium_polyedra.AAC.1